MERADIIKKNRNEWFDKACKYKETLLKVKKELERKDHCILAVNIVVLIEQALKGNTNARTMDTRRIE